MLAAGDWRHLQPRRLRSLKDIPIVAIIDMPCMDEIPRALTTIRPPTAGLGKQAAAILVDMINGTPILNRRVLLAPELIVRNSVATIGETKPKARDGLASYRSAAVRP